MPDSELIETIYGAVLHPEQWTNALQGIAGLLGAKDVSINAYNAETRALDVLCPSVDPYFVRTYSEDWAHRNFLWEYTAALPAGQMFGFESVLDRHDFERTAFYNEWWRPQQMDHAIGTNLLVEGPLTVVVTACRPAHRGAFSNDESAAFRALFAHLQRAAELRHRFGDAVRAAADFRCALELFGKAAVLADRDCKMLYSNAAAARLIKAKVFRLAADRTIAAARADETVVLHRLLLGTFVGGSGGRIVLHRASGRPVTLLVAPLHRSTSAYGRRVSLILIDDPDQAGGAPSDGELLRLLYGLTKAEARLAVALAGGTRLRDAAERLGVTFATVRTHLARIFDKTGVASQAELVRLLVKSGIDAADTFAERPRSAH